MYVPGTDAVARSFADDHAMDGSVHHLELDVAEGGEPVQGVLRLATGEPRAFVGYLELIQLLETARAPSVVPEGPRDPAAGP